MSNKEKEVVINAPKQDDFLKFMGVLFSTTIRGKEKIRILKEEFDYDFDEDFYEKVRECDTLGDAVEQQGINKGLLQGLLFAIKALMKNQNKSLDEALILLDIPLSSKEVFEKHMEK